MRLECIAQAGHGLWAFCSKRHAAAVLYGRRILSGLHDLLQRLHLHVQRECCRTVQPCGPAQTPPFATASKGVRVAELHLLIECISAQANTKTVTLSPEQRSVQMSKGWCQKTLSVRGHMTSAGLHVQHRCHQAEVSLAIQPPLQHLLPALSSKRVH